MLIIYRGLGFVVLLFVTLAIIAGNAIQLHLHFNDHVLNVVIVAMFALCCVVFDEIDGYDSTFFFIGVGTWGYLAVLVPCGFYAWHVYQDRLGLAGVKTELAEFIQPPSVISKALAAAATAAPPSPPAEQKAPPPQQIARPDDAPAAAPVLAVPAEPATPVAAPSMTGMQDKFQAVFPNSPASIAITTALPLQDATIAAPAVPSAAPAPPQQTQNPAPAPVTPAAPSAEPTPSPVAKNPVHRIPTFSWSPQSRYDAIAKVDKKWVLGNTLLDDGTAVQAKMEADDWGINVTITVDADTDKRKVFVYEVDSTDASFELTRYRVKIDDAETHQSRFYQPDAKVVENEIQLNFLDFAVLRNELLGQNADVNLGDTRAARGVWSILGAIVQAEHLQQYNILTARADGTLSQLAHAGSVIVELPLADGSDNFVEIDPQDSYVRTFVQEKEQQLGTLPDAAATSAPATGTATDAQATPDWCPRAKRPAENLICTTPQLVADENKMETLYHSLIATGASQTVRPLVRSWLGRRNGCETLAGDAAEVTCIHATYGQLIGQLEQLAR